MKVESSIIQNKYLRVQTLNYGASLYEVFHKNKKINLILDLGSKKNYRFKHASVGSTCGRYAGRISNSKFQISKEQYILSSNEGKNTLHGGKTGFSKLPWKKIKQTKDKIVYQLYSPDNDQGFPGNLIVNCTYQVKNKFLHIKYEYISDKKTHVNLTNHSYWNLEKNKKNMIYNHDLKLNSNKYLQVNKNLIPTGNFKSVKKSIFDFINTDNINKINNNIRVGVQTFIPEINLENVIITPEPDQNYVNVKVEYSMRISGETDEIQINFE